MVQLITQLKLKMLKKYLTEPLKGGTINTEREVIKMKKFIIVDTTLNKIVGVAPTIEVVKIRWIAYKQYNPKGQLKICKI